jgi:hypothetical protein
VCSREACQRERHRRACAEWHRRNPGYDAGERLRRRLVAGAAHALARVDPVARVDWAAARDAVGLEVAVIVEETGRVLAGWVRDALSPQPLEAAAESGRLASAAPRDAFGPSGPEA